MKPKQIFSILIFLCSLLLQFANTIPANAQERLPSSCWAANTNLPSGCEGEVNTDLFPFCPSEDLYEQVKDMMPSQAARLGCETDVEGRLVKVLSCSYTSCNYSLYYGYDEWKTMWSQSGIVRK